MKREVATEALAKANAQLRKLRDRIEQEQAKQLHLPNDAIAARAHASALLDHLEELTLDGLRHRAWLEQQLETSDDGDASQTGRDDERHPCRSC